MQSHSAKEGHLEVTVAFLPIVLIFYPLPFREPGLFFVYTLIFKGKQKFESCLWPELRHLPAVFQCFICMAVFLLVSSQNVSYLIVNLKHVFVFIVSIHALKIQAKMLLNFSCCFYYL